LDLQEAGAKQVLLETRNLEEYQILQTALMDTLLTGHQLR